MQPFIHVSPEKSSERNLVTSVMGALSDYMPRNQYRTCGSTEQVFSVKFEGFGASSKFDMSPKLNFSECNLAYSTVLSLVTCKGSYIWGISFGGNATLLYSERNTCTVDMKLLPTPSHTGDSLFSSRPLMAICDTFSCASQWQVRFISLCDRKVVLSYYLESRALSVDANDRFVVVTRTDSITVFSALTLTELYTIAYVNSTLWSDNLPKNVPSSLGVRWLAFADSKPVYQHLSRCGDASTDESQPLTTTVLSMNKRLWEGISAFATSVVSSSLGPNPPNLRYNHLDSQHQVSQTTLSDPFPQHGSSPITSEVNNSYISPGYVTIIDLHTLNCEHETLRKLENGTASVRLCSAVSNLSDSSNQYNRTNQRAQSSSPNNQQTSIKMSGVKYLNVHEFGGSGAIVAHFMAHRWAGVAFLKFDPSGSLLFTACKRGHSFNLFRIANHPFDQRQTSVHHLYILERGNLPCEIVDATFSHDSRWVAVSSNHGTTHVFPVTAYGGPITVRTHTRPHVVNRTSRYHRSSGLEEYHLTRPQPERGATESTGLSSNSSSNSIPCQIPQSSSMKHLYTIRSQSSGFASGVSRATSNFCQTAPIAGFAPQCPHLGFTAFMTPLKETPDCCINERSSNSLSIPAGDSALSDASLFFTHSNPFSESSSGHLHVSEQPTMFLNSEGLCACPPNALYNTINSRLPPYPEPCRVKAEARLKPSSGNSVTSIARGAASSAFEAVTPMKNINAVIVNRHLSSVKSCYSDPNHVHCPEVCTYTQLPVSTASRPSLHSRKHNRRHKSGQSLQNLNQDISIPTSSVRAARFGPPVCFLPNQLRLNNVSSDYRSDPYVGKSRAVDALFILTADLRLIEYDLCVSADDTATVGGKLYQDGSIRLDCVPVGEWNLHTDAVYLPPFPKQHPLILASSTLQARLDGRSEISLESDNNRLSTSTNYEKIISTLKSSLPSSNSSQMKSGLLEVNTSIEDINNNDDNKGKNNNDEDDNAVTPAGWTAEDVASYWYSQVEITTHLGPLRRVWMGPQFTFHTYSKQRDWGGCDLRFSSFNSCGSSNNNNISSTTQIGSTAGNLTTALHPTLLEAFTLNAPFVLPPLIDMTSELLIKDRYPATFIPSSHGSNSSLNMIPYQGSSTSSTSSVHAFIHPHPQHHPNIALTAINRNATSSKTIMLPRLPSGLLLDSNASFNSAQLRWRNSSGEPTRPLSIAGGIGPSGETIVIEGGSYQDSSLGSSLSSLVGRGTDDLAQSIAEAIQMNKDSKKNKTKNNTNNIYQNENLSSNVNLLTNKSVKRKHGKKRSKMKRHSAVISDEFTAPTSAITNLYPSGYESLSDSPIIQSLYYNFSDLSTFSLPGDLQVNTTYDSDNMMMMASSLSNLRCNQNSLIDNEKNTKLSMETFQIEENSQNKVEYPNDVKNFNAVSDDENNKSC
ncbi:gtpase activating protein-related [Schistosoma mansoni]|uniref:gtpase activating protein-related n=1 Tax=Schistosoma mansoni TaxID=6183 RepID=UPI00022DC439|nr:gtpase activating protein-related [Schistosoma mansoni]|eukprot:XP_018652110.1 gtpase activating protein-related [Schistosoma mansoni]